MEELEAVDWYNQRVDACKDDELKAILEHNRDEEIEHAEEEGIIFKLLHNPVRYIGDQKGRVRQVECLRIVGLQVRLEFVGGSVWRRVRLVDLLDEIAAFVGTNDHRVPAWPALEHPHRYIRQLGGHVRADEAGVWDQRFDFR